MRGVAAALLLGLTLSCGRDERRTERSSDSNTVLGGESAARVGQQVLPLSVVASVANAQGISPRDAARKIVDDEIAASAARANGREKLDPTAWLLVAARARFTADAMWSEARRAGPPTDEEIATLSARHWVEVDRPPTVRVMHAIVMRPKNTALLDAARAAAVQMQAALVLASDDEFEAKAKANVHDSKLDLRVEKLPAIAEDGRVAEGSGEMDAVFSKAAYALAGPGSTSGVVETRFGFHVIRLLERIPEKRMPIENRRLAFTEEAYVMRAHDMKTARLAALRATTPIAIEPAAEQLMRSVKVSRDPSGTP